MTGLIRWIRARLADVQREHRIRTCAQAALRAEGNARRALFTRLRTEVLARSPAQVERMERARGLR